MIPKTRFVVVKKTYALPLAAAYTPHEALTVDEQLFPYRVHTRFAQYIPSKPTTLVHRAGDKKCTLHNNNFKTFL